MVPDASRSNRGRTVLIRCIDCKILIGTQNGSIPETEIQWSLCTRCTARRNGMVGAKTANELGIY